MRTSMTLFPCHIGVVLFLVAVVCGRAEEESNVATSFSSPQQSQQAHDTTTTTTTTENDKQQQLTTLQWTVETNQQRRQAFDELVTWVRRRQVQQQQQPDDDDDNSSSSSWIDDRLGLVVDTSMGLPGIGNTAGNNDETTSSSTTSSTIPAGTMILRIPAPAIILATSDDCQAIYQLTRELGQGRDSRWWPLLRFFWSDDTENANADNNNNAVGQPIAWQRFVTFWSRAAVEALQGLAPSDEAPRHLGWYQQSCLGRRDFRPFVQDPQAMMEEEEERQALLLLISYASSVGIPPIYHWMNHHRGLINTKIVIEHDDNHHDNGTSAMTALEVHTTRDVPPGQALYMDYGRPTSGDLFRDYAFVEEWPRTWRFESPAAPPAIYWMQRLYESLFVMESSSSSESSESKVDDDDDDDETWWGIVQEWMTATLNNNHDSTTHAFSVYPHDVVKLYCHDDLDDLQPSGSRPVQSLAKQQQAARQHNDQTVSDAMLQRFIQDATVLLQITLPTTVQQDKELLQQQRQQQEPASKLPPDVMQAVKYRLQVKQDVQTALDFAKNLLRERRKPTDDATGGSNGNAEL